MCAVVSCLFIAMMVKFMSISSYLFNQNTGQVLRTMFLEPLSNSELWRQYPCCLHHDYGCRFNPNNYVLCRMLIMDVIYVLAMLLLPCHTDLDMHEHVVVDFVFILNSMSIYQYNMHYEWVYHAYICCLYIHMCFIQNILACICMHV